MANSAKVIVGALVLVAGLLIAAACAPAMPTPTAAPPKPAATTPPATKQGEVTPAATKPAATAAAKPAANAGWQTEWDTVLAAANREGKVVVTGPPGDLWRAGFMKFQEAYPGIKIELSGSSSAQIVPKILAERQAGLKLWDVFVGGGAVTVDQWIPAKAMGSLRPALILPEVPDDSAWHQGFEDGWADAGRLYHYLFFAYLTDTVFVNRQFVSKEKLSKIDQLVDPIWKGMIAWRDPRNAGTGQMSAAHLMNVKGEDWYRRLLAQNPTLNTDERAQAEGLVRGKFPIAVAVNRAALQDFKNTGLADQIETLDPTNPAAGYMTSGPGGVGLFDGSPNPNAAKVFINWLLSQKGQSALVESTQAYYSRRLNVKGPPDLAPQSGVRYENLSKESMAPVLEKASKIATEVLR